MNRKQRLKNRSTARELNSSVRAAQLLKHTCENCGQPGGHWHGMGLTIEDIVEGRPERGFWSCQSNKE